MARLALAFLLLMGKSVLAADYSQPSGAPQVFIPEHGVTVSVWAIDGVLGDGLAIFEKRVDGTWYLCGQCFPIQELNLQNEVNFKGGVVPWIDSQRESINNVLALRYPKIISNSPQPGGSLLNQINFALFNSFKLENSGGQPSLSPK